MSVNVFASVFQDGGGTMTTGDFFLTLAIALALGFLLAVACNIKNRFSKSFLLTLAVIPAVVAVIIIMVNGSIGVGIAVAGAFSLVRFRSAQGSAKEICAIFIAMAAGLAAGTGYLMYAFLFTLITAVVFVTYSATKFGEKKADKKGKILKITIPEDLDYTDVFKSILDEYTENAELVAVKTTNMGSMFKLTYEIQMKNNVNEKEFLDKLRVRNGNLEISVGRQELQPSEL